MKEKILLALLEHGIDADKLHVSLRFHHAADIPAAASRLTRLQGYVLALSEVAASEGDQDWSEKLMELFNKLLCYYSTLPIE